MFSPIFSPNNLKFLLAISKLTNQFVGSTEVDWGEGNGVGEASWGKGDGVGEGLVGLDGVEYSLFKASDGSSPDSHTCSTVIFSLQHGHRTGSCRFVVLDDSSSIDVAEVKSTIESCSSRFIDGVELGRQEMEGKMVSRLMEGGVIAGEST